MAGRRSAWHRQWCRHAEPALVSDSSGVDSGSADGAPADERTPATSSRPGHPLGQGRCSQTAGWPGCLRGHPESLRPRAQNVARQCTSAACAQSRSAGARDNRPNASGRKNSIFLAFMQSKREPAHKFLNCYLTIHMHITLQYLGICQKIRKTAMHKALLIAKAYLL